MRRLHPHPNPPPEGEGILLAAGWGGLGSGYRTRMYLVPRPLEASVAAPLTR